MSTDISVRRELVREYQLAILIIHKSTFLSLFFSSWSDGSSVLGACAPEIHIACLARQARKRGAAQEHAGRSAVLPRHVLAEADPLRRSP